MPPKRAQAASYRVTRRPSRKSRKSPPSTFPRTTKSAGKTPTPPSTMAESPKDKDLPQEGSEPLYFWKPDQAHGYLSQWFRSPWTHGGDEYQTAEMWMMVGKARLFGDQGIAREMLTSTDPRRHKALGRKVKHFDGKVWGMHKLRIVAEGNYHKFTISEDAERLRAMLLETRERELVEASPLDRIWGVGFGEKNAGANRARWGQNLLGKALMLVRERLRKEAEGKEGREGKEEVE